MAKISKFSARGGKPAVSELNALPIRMSHVKIKTCAGEKNNCLEKYPCGGGGEA
jgi:hypothetical protein